jgi:peptidoglycan/LPS O-acetylase OafA/YrhL
MLIVFSSWLMILGLAVDDRISSTSKFMSFKALLLVGSFSYSLYLVHYPVVLLISKLGFSCQMGEVGFTAMSVLVSLALAFAYYRLVELRSV